MISTSTTNNIASGQVLTLFGQICSAQQSKKRAKKLLIFHIVDLSLNKKVKKIAILVLLFWKKAKILYNNKQQNDLEMSEKKLFYLSLAKNLSGN